MGLCSYPGAVNTGNVNFFGDATKIPLQTGSVGAVFMSCLPKPLRAQAIQEANRVLEVDGLFIWQAVVKADIEVSEQSGFVVKQYIRRWADYRNDPNHPDEYLYNVILQKVTASE